MKYCPLCGKEYAEGTTCERDGAVLIRSQPGTELMIGQVLKDSYRIEEKIGEGGMAAVFRGVQMPLERNVAIKVLLPTLHSTPSMIQRFFQEAKLLCQMNHPNVVQIIDFGNTENGLVYMVMEFLRGLTLRQKVPAGGLPTDVVLRLMRQICDGVGAAHNRGLVHRDLKPDNIFILEQKGESDQVKILDFGIARAVEDGQQKTRLTQTGLVMGTPGFLAPEQIGGASEADARSDIYALGAILYLLLTGSRPYEGATPHSILVQQLQELPKLDLGVLAGQPRLAGVVSKAMHREPDQRYQSAAELFADLVRAAGGAAPGSKAARELESRPTEVLGAGRSGDTSTGRSGDPATDATVLLGAKPRRTPSRRQWLLGASVAALLALAFALWRLAPDEGAAVSASDATGDTVMARGVSEDRVLVGMSAAFSGPAKELGRGMQLGIETCFDEINESGGVHGRELELVALDDGYEPSQTVANMAELLLERGVFSILGNVGTPTAEVALPLALEQGAPFFGAFTGADLLRRQPPDRHVFNYRASYAEETAALVEYLLDVRGLAPGEIVVFAQEDGFGDAGYRGVAATLAARGHEEPVPRLGYRRNRIDITPAVETLLREHPGAKAVVIVATYRPAAELIKELEESELDLLYGSLSFVGSRALAEELGELGPDYADGVIVTQVVPHYDSPLPGVERYRRALEKHAPSEQPGFVSLEGYLACRVFAAALEKTGRELTVDSFLTAAEGLGPLDLGLGTPFHLRAGEKPRPVWGTRLDASANYQELDLGG